MGKVVNEEVRADVSLPHSAGEKQLFLSSWCASCKCFPLLHQKQLLLVYDEVVRERPHPLPLRQQQKNTNKVSK